MQRATHSIALVSFALTTAACTLDQAPHDRAMAEIEATRREAAREGRLQALEREHAFLMQQIATLSAGSQASLMQTSVKEDDRDRRLADLSSQIAGVAQMISTWREEERPQPVNAEATRIAEQVSEQDRAVMISKVQALLDAGRIKLTMRGGRIQIAQVRPIDVVNPYLPPPEKPGAPQASPPPPPKRPIDRLGF